MLVVLAADHLIADEKAFTQDVATAAALAREGERFEIDLLGELCAATVRLQPLYDPQGLKLRS